MRKPLRPSIFLAVMLALLLTACGASEPAAQAVEGYWQALADQDGDMLANASCADWEANAQIELDSLVSVGSRLESMQCQEAGQAGTDTLVSCQGKLILDYNGEIQELDLASRDYLARQENGEWRFCGYYLATD